MKDNLHIAIKFSQKVEHLKGILHIVLFGSVARGEDKATSDIDIAIVYNKIDKYKLIEEISRYKHEKIQLTFIDLKNLPRETELAGALSGDGLLLYGQPIKIQAEEIGLKPKVLIQYSMSLLPQTEKVKLNRALYGSLSRSESKGKKYKTETKGLVNAPGVKRIDKGVLLADRRKSTNIINLLKRFNAQTKEMAIWTY